MEMFLAEYGWIIWVGIILIFVIIEMFTLELTFLMLGLGSIAGLVGQLVGAPWWLQILLAAIFAIALLIVRPPLRRWLDRGADPAKSNVEALIGLTGVSQTAITSVSGQVKLTNGDQWSARTEDGSTIAEGDQVSVVRIDGAVAVVTASQKG